MKSMIGLAFVSGLALAACSPAAPETGAKPAAEAAPEAKITGVERLDPAIDAIIKPGELPVMVASGFRFVEGPLWVGDRLRFSDLMDNKLYELADGGEAKLIMDKSGGLDEMAPDSFQGSNGSIVDKDGSILMTQHGARRIVRLDDQMKLSVYLDKANGKRLNSPNDLAFTPDGALWFTDPPYGLVVQDKDPAK